MIQIDEALGVLHAIVVISVQLDAFNCNVPGNESSDKHGESAADHSVMGVTISIKVQTNLVSEEVLAA